MRYAELILKESYAYQTRPPALVYHGSKARAIKDFEYRSGKRAAWFDVHDVKANGFFFALTPQEAKEFGPHVSAYRITCNHPLVFGTDGVDGVRDPKRRANIRYCLSALFGPPAPGDTHVRFEGMNDDVYVPIEDLQRNDYGPDETDWIQNFMGGPGLDWEVLDHPEVVRRMRERGYDGTVVYEKLVDSKVSWFVISPQQIQWVEEVVPQTDDFD